MMDHLEGVLHSKGPTSIRLQVGPVRIDLSVPLSTSRQLPEPGGRAGLWTHLHWKDEGPSLFGFASKRERDLFRMLLGVQGVGPTGALSLLSHLPPAELLGQIRSRSLEGLTRVPRIGQKTAGRILVDLGPKVDQMVLVEGEEEPIEGEHVPGAEDAVSALTALGYPQREARKAVEATLRAESGIPLDECIRRALLKLTRQGG